MDEGDDDDELDEEENDGGNLEVFSKCANGEDERNAVEVAEEEV